MVTGRLEALVVEDDDAIREVLRDLLEGAGYVVRDATDGAHALAILRASEYGLVILLDILLPGLNGAEVVAALDGDGAEGAASGNHARLTLERHGWIVITASPQSITPKFAQRLAELGAPVIAKPFDLTTLMAAVDQAALRLLSQASRQNAIP
jgi:CheY-like chemotaxis protein